MLLASRNRVIPFLSLACALLVLAAGCSPSAPVQGVTPVASPSTSIPTVAAPGAPSAFEGLMASLIQAGAAPELPSDSEVDHGFAIKGTRIVAFGQDFFVYQFPTPADSAAAAAQVSPDGYNITRTESGQTVQRHGDWISPPHFYRKDNLIVVYSGSDAKMMNTLSDLLGPQFAGAAETGGASQPKWLADLIARFQSEPVANPPRAVYRYLYKGQTVYYVPPAAGDQYSQLYDDQGKLLCAPDGGIIGKGDGKCPDFESAAQNRELLWQDNR